MDISPRPSALPLIAPETSQALNIVTISDEHYAQHLSVMLVSLFENNRTHSVDVFIIISNKTQEYIVDKIRN